MALSANDGVLIPFLVTRNGDVFRTIADENMEVAGLDMKSSLKTGAVLTASALLAHFTMVGAANAQRCDVRMDRKAPQGRTPTPGVIELRKPILAGSTGRIQDRMLQNSPVEMAPASRSASPPVEYAAPTGGVSKGRDAVQSNSGRVPEGVEYGENSPKKEELACAK